MTPSETAAEQPSGSDPEATREATPEPDHEPDPRPARADTRAGSRVPGERPADVRSALLRAAGRELGEVGASAISLRAIARRAGVSHAAPKHHFGDRAGLLTAMATDGYRALEAALVAAATAATAAGTDPAHRLAALGRAYIASALADPEVFTLMFRPELLHRDDQDLVAAQRAAFAPLARITDQVAAGGRPDAADGATPAGDLPLLAWSFAHGVATLARTGALQSAPTAGTAGTAGTTELVHRLADEFASRMTRGG